MYTVSVIKPQAAVGYVYGECYKTAGSSWLCVQQTAVGLYVYQSL